MKKTISIIILIIGIIYDLFGLFVGISSIGADWLSQIGILFILPSIIAFIILLFDLLITIDKIEKGYVYSWISTIFKLGIAALFIPSIIYNFKLEAQNLMSNLYFYLMIVIPLIILSIPSIFNIIKLKSKK
jgi:hypothetical protein